MAALERMIAAMAGGGWKLEKIKQRKGPVPKLQASGPMGTQSEVDLEMHSGSLLNLKLKIADRSLN